MKYKKEPYIKQRQGVNGQWSFQVYIRSEIGTVTKTFNEKDYGSSKLAFDTAVKFKNQALTDIANKTIFKANNVTVNDCFEEYLETTTDSYKTKEHHSGYYNKYVTIKDKKIQEVTKADIIRELNSLTETCSDDVISRIYSIWKKDIIETAINNEYIIKDVTVGIRKPQSHIIPKKKSTVTDRQTVIFVENLILKNLLNKYNARMIFYYIELLFYTGMRPAEATALNRDDIYDDYISINKEIGSNRYQNHVIRRCKTPTSVRNIPITPALRPIINELLSFSRTYELFKNDEGEYMHAEWVGSVIYNKLKSYNKDKDEKEKVHFYLYRLRHNVATELITNNVDSKTTMDILGHSSFNMSLYYANSNDEKKKEALTLLS